MLESFPPGTEWLLHCFWMPAKIQLTPDATIGSMAN